MGNAVKRVANICTDRRQDAPTPALEGTKADPAEPKSPRASSGRGSGGGGGALGDPYGAHLSALEQAAIGMGSGGGSGSRSGRGSRGGSGGSSSSGGGVKGGRTADGGDGHSLQELEKLLTFFEKRCKSGPRELPQETRLDSIMQRLAMDFWCELPADAAGTDLPPTASGSVLGPVPRCKYLVWMGSGRPPLGEANTALRLEDGSLAFQPCSLVRNNRNSTLRVMLRKERRSSRADDEERERDSSRARDVPTTYLRRIPGLTGDVVDESTAIVAPRSKDSDEQTQYEDGYTGVPDDYICTSKVGQGAFSQVFMGRNTRTGEPVCLKVLRPTRPEKILREESLVRELRGGPNIVLLLDALREPRTHTPCLVFEAVNDLGWRRIRHADDIRHYTYELLRGIAYAHERSIFHRDLKPGNVLVDSPRSSVRIIDWGLADWYTPGKLYGSCGTPNFKPPEMLIDASTSSRSGESSSSRRRREYGLGVDIWSLGCMYGALLLGVYRLFNARSKVCVFARLSPARALSISLRARLRCCALAHFCSPTPLLLDLTPPPPPSLSLQQRSAQLLAVAKLLGVDDLRRWIEGTKCKLDTDSLLREGCPHQVTWSNCKGCVASSFRVSPPATFVLRLPPPHSLTFTHSPSPPPPSSSHQLGRGTTHPRGWSRSPRRDDEMGPR